MRVAYLYAVYFGVGLPQENFCWSKGNIWLQIGRLDRAIGCYRESLRALENPRLRALLGWCYHQAGDDKAALENYRLAFKAQPRHDTALALAWLEFEVGDRATGLSVLKGVQDARERLDPRLAKQLERLEADFAVGVTS